uniref:WSN domain-containing protein n=1 Tax=Caenorhabditis tropicalis TaxID=1561998 RepID=A0A1I7U651_9PELO
MSLSESEHELEKRGSEENQEVTFHQVVKELSSLGRVVDAIDIERRLKKGSLIMSTLIRELLDLNKSLTAKSLDKDKFNGLVKDLNRFVSIVEKECKGEASSKFDVVAKGINSILSIKDLKMSPKVFEEGSALHLYHSVIENLKKLDIRINSLLKVISGGLKPEHENMKFYVDCDTTVKGIIKISQNQKNMKEMNLGKVKTEIDSLLSSERVKEAFKKDGVDIGEWEKSLKAPGKALKVFQSTFTKEGIDEVNSSIQHLLDAYLKIFFSFEQKIETSGFPNGAIDLANLPIDMKSEIFVEHLGVTEDVLKSLFPTVLQLNEKLKTILEIKIKAMSSDIENVVHSFQTSLNASRTELESFNTILALFDCDDMFRDIPKTNLESEKNRIANTEQTWKQFVGKLNMPTLNALPEFLKIFSKNPGEIPTAFKEFKQMAEVQKELNDVKKHLEDIDFNSLKAFLSNSIVISLFEQASELLKPGGFFNCVSNQTMLTDAKKVFDNGASFSMILNLKSLKDKVDNISSAIQMEESFLTELGILESTSMTKPKREAKDIPDLGKDVSKKMNKAVQILVGLDDASKPEVKKFKDQIPNIDTQISKLPDSAEKKELVEMYTPAVKKTIVWAVKEAEIVSKQTFPPGLSGYNSTMQLSFNFDGTVNVSFAPICRRLRQLNTSYPDAESEKLLAIVHLDLANSKVVMTEGDEAFGDILQFFNQYTTEIDESIRIFDKTVEGKVILAILFFLIGVFCVVFLVWIICAVKKHKEKTRLAKLVTRLEKYSKTLKDAKPIVRQDSKSKKTKYVCISKDEPEMTELPIDVRLKELRKLVENRKEEIMAKYEELLKKNERKVEEVKQQGICQDALNAKLLNGFDKGPIRIQLHDITFFENLEQLVIDENEANLCTKVIRFDAYYTEYDVGVGTDIYLDVVDATVGDRTETKEEQDDKKTFEEEEKKKCEKQEKKKFKDAVNKTLEKSRKILKSHESTKTNPKDVADMIKKEEETAKEPSADRHSGGADKKEAEEEKFFLPMFQRSYEQILKDYNQDIFDWDLSKVKTSKKNPSSPFLRDFRDAKTNKIIYPKLLCQMMSKEFLEVKSWPHTDANGVTYDCPILLSDYVEVQRDAREVGNQQTEAYIEVNSPQAVIVGDIHGQPRDLVYALNNHIAEDRTVFVFLGDYVDRGERNIDVALFMAVMMACFVSLFSHSLPLD